MAPAIPVAVPATAAAPPPPRFCRPPPPPPRRRLVWAGSSSCSRPDGPHGVRKAPLWFGHNWHKPRLCPCSCRPPHRAVTTLMLGMGRSVTPAAATGTLFSLAARFTAPGRGVAAFLEKLLFPSSENKFLTAVATG